ncbi:MAG: hypothetical protein ACJAZO_004532 [Myxococcota bacterium]|jgi:hypothetical protein
MENGVFAGLDVGLEWLKAALDQVVDMLGRVVPPAASTAETLSVQRRLAAVATSLIGWVRFGELAPMVSDTVAMGTDIADEWIADNMGGDEFEARYRQASTRCSPCRSLAFCRPLTTVPTRLQIDDGGRTRRFVGRHFGDGHGHCR